MWESIQFLPVIEGLALVAGEPVERCRDRGARWTLERVLERRLPIQTIMLVRRANGAGIAYAKALVGRATPERVDALGRAIDNADRQAARAALDEWVPDGRQDHTRLADALADAFSRPSGESQGDGSEP